MGVSMPDDIAADPVQCGVWASIAPEGNRFTEQDVPTLRLLCYWHAVARQAQDAIHAGDGRIAILDRVGTKPYKAENGRAAPLYRKNPALAVLKEATAEIRALSAELGVSPTARARLGASGAPAPQTANANLLQRMFSARAEREGRAHGA